MDDAVVQFGWHHIGLRALNVAAIIAADRDMGNAVNV
jgi:hypothetical protein